MRSAGTRSPRRFSAALSVGAKHQRGNVHPFLTEPVEDKPRHLVVTEDAREGTAGTQAGDGNKGGASQAAALSFPATNAHLGVRRGVITDVQQVIDGHAAEAEDIEHLIRTSWRPRSEPVADAASARARFRPLDVVVSAPFWHAADTAS